MKTIFKSIVLLAAIVLSSGSQAQVINGDLNHNGELDVDDVTLLIDGYLTGETEAIKSTVNPYMVDNSLIAGTWLVNGKLTLFYEDGSLGDFFEGQGYTYKFFPYQKHILIYNESGAFVAEWKVLWLTDKTMYLDGTYGECRRAKIYEAVDLGLSVKWASMNVGANVPEEYGDYFAWGDTWPKDNYSIENYWCWDEELGYLKYSKKDEKTTLVLADDAACTNCGGTWRMPTPNESWELETKCSWEWTTLNGVNGQKVTGPNGNSIFLPAAGQLIGSYHVDEGKAGYYWLNCCTSGYNPGDGKDSSYDLYFDSGGQHGLADYRRLRYYGQSVRAVCP
ncbi:MAG: hypothetical protein IJ901_11355 [Bacteroidaceae bacterium]|nr:hypothetical protein [Bacteroidaceae bacterium]